MTRFTLVILAAVFFVACKNKKTTEATGAAVSHTDTLQFVSFDGNADYWISVFVNSKKDTVSLVTDSAIADSFKNKLFEVTWFVDTLFEAGDNDRKYAAKRMIHFSVINGKPFVVPVAFVPPISEKQILEDVKNLPEVMGNADQVVIAERPSEGKDFYLIETGTHGEDNYSRFAMFRVYYRPKYEIRVFDMADDTDVSLEEWRKQNTTTP